VSIHHSASESPDHADTSWMIEFQQDYGGGIVVNKRGLDATPMVALKYEIGVNEVMAFSNFDGGVQATSVFHFHPDFAAEERRQYMQQHSEGYEVVLEVRADIRAAADELRIERKNRLRSFGRSISMAIHTMILYLLTHNPDAQ